MFTIIWFIQVIKWCKKYTKKWFLKKKQNTYVCYCLYMSVGHSFISWSFGETNPVSLIKSPPGFEAAATPQHSRTAADPSPQESPAIRLEIHMGSTLRRWCFQWWVWTIASQNLPCADVNHQNMGNLGEIVQSQSIASCQWRYTVGGLMVPKKRPLVSS